MKKQAVRLLLALAVLLTLLPVQVFAADTENPFRDVQQGDWCYDAVQYACVNGLFNGTSATTFSPNGTMTRGMFMTVLARMSGVNPDDYSGASAFADVPEDSYFAPYVAWATRYGITTGTGDGSFSPDACINRQQMAVFFVRYFEAFDVDYETGANITTVPADIGGVSAYARDAVLKLWRQGFLNGDGVNFDPAGDASRAQAVTICHRVDQVVETWYSEPGVVSDRVKLDPTTGMPYGESNGQNPSVPSPAGGSRPDDSDDRDSIREERNIAVYIYEYRDDKIVSEEMIICAAGQTLAAPARVGYTFLGWTGTGIGNTPVPHYTIPAGTTGPLYLTTNWRRAADDKVTVIIQTRRDNNRISERLITCTAGQTLTESTMDGYVFLGWTGTGIGDAPVLSYTIPAGVADPLYLTENWRRIEEGKVYVLYYEYRDGKAVSESMEQWEIGRRLEVPGEEPGYIFLGWTGTGIGDTPVDSYTVPGGITEQLIIKANWKTVPYKISYEMNGGTNAAENPETYTVADRIELAAPVRSGYIFQGWYETADFSGEPVTAIPRKSTGDKTLHAKWEGEYRIGVWTFEYRDGTVNAERYETYAVGQALEPVAIPGYTFLGYTFTGAGNFPVASLTVPAGTVEDMCLDANYKAIAYDIDYELNGGINAGDNPKTYTVENEVTLTAPSRDGYTFQGWYETADFSGGPVTAIPKGNTENRTFYAKWDFTEFAG